MLRVIIREDDHDVRWLTVFLSRGDHGSGAGEACVCFGHASPNLLSSFQAQMHIPGILWIAGRGYVGSDRQRREGIGACQCSHASIDLFGMQRERANFAADNGQALAHILTEPSEEVL